MLYLFKTQPSFHTCSLSRLGGANLYITQQMSAVNYPTTVMLKEVVQHKAKKSQCLSFIITGEVSQNTQRRKDT